jgi:hypothetical protein
VPSDVRLLAGIATAVLALVCLASAGRLAFALRRGGSRQGAALVWAVAALGVGAAAAAGAIVLKDDSVLDLLAAGAAIVAAIALGSAMVGDVDQLVDGGRGKRQASMLAERRGHALATATRLSEVAERASTREAVLELLVEGVRSAVGSEVVVVRRTGPSPVGSLCAAIVNCPLAWFATVNVSALFAVNTVSAMPCDHHIATLATSS